MKLTLTAIRAAKPKDKPYKMFDSGGLFLQITPNGSKLWRMKFKLHGREKLLSFGPFPAVSLDEARYKRDTERRLLERGVDPSEQKKTVDREDRIGRSNTFESVAREWHGRQLKRWSTAYAARILLRMETDVFPRLGTRPIADVTAGEILDCLRRIERRGAHEQARRAHQHIACTLRFGVATGRVTRDVSADLRGALDATQTRSNPAVTTPAELAKLLDAIENYTEGTPTVRAGLLILAHVFCRPTELRLAQWREVDLDARTWSVPAARTKLRRAHVIPLSPQVVTLFRALKAETGSGDYVLPNARDAKRPASINVFRAVLDRLGYLGRHSPHGFRSTASTLLHERGFDSDTIEAQLAHKVAGVKGVYMRSTFLEERARMLEWWSNYLDGIDLM
jgi:integrase